MVFKKLFRKTSNGKESNEKIDSLPSGDLSFNNSNASLVKNSSNHQREIRHFSSSSSSTAPLPPSSHLPHSGSRQQQLGETKQHRISSVPTSFLRQRSDSNGNAGGLHAHHRSLSSNIQDPSSLIENPSVPKELVPIITLIQAQQARIYYDGYLKLGENFVESKLSGTELSFWTPTINEPTYINLSDAIFQYFKNLDQFTLTILLNNSKQFIFAFDTVEDLNVFYSALLLSQFEYRQLQESFTGLLLSAKGVLLSDIRTILAPENRFPKSEWCVLRFPYLNNKWIKCYVVVIPGEKTLLKNSTSGIKEKPGKIEIYTSSKTSKKNLLATIINGRSCYSVYPERPEFIDTNALLHMTGNIYINEDKLLELTLNDQTLTKKSSTSSLHKFSSPRSPIVSTPNNNMSRSSSVNTTSNNINYFHRSESSQSLLSEASSISKKLKNAKLLRTSLCLLIPEAHPSVKQFDTMIRLLIPILNTFKLYGRPTKFLSQRNDKHSLLFGLPQLPHTEYLDSETSLKLVELNITNSLNESWNTDDWVQVFKEMILFKLTKGYKGSGNVFDVFKEGLIYTKAQRSDEDIYLSDNELLEFIDMGQEGNSALSSPRGTFIDRSRSRSSSFQQLPPSDLHGRTSSINSRLNSPLGKPELDSNPFSQPQQQQDYLSSTPVQQQQQQQPHQQQHDYRNLLSVTNNYNGQQGRSPLQNEYYLDDTHLDDTIDKYLDDTLARSFTSSKDEQFIAA